MSVQSGERRQMTEFEREELDQKEIEKKLGQPCRDWDFAERSGENPDRIYKQLFKKNKV